MLMGVDSDC